jgi:tryptophanyl-tRNA synthetase
MKAVTDAGPAEPNQEPAEPIQNLFAIMDLVSKPETANYFREQYAQCSIRYGDLKKQLAEDIVNYLTPIREKYHQIVNDNDYLGKVAAEGRDKARASAIKTMTEVRKAIGINRL